MGADPLFVNPGYFDDNGTPDDPADDVWVRGDFRLQPGSPAINAADPNWDLSDLATDLAGNPRVLCGAADIGPYEFGAGDYDCDQVVDLLDFSAWAFCETDPAGEPTGGGSPPPYDETCTPFDVDASGTIDLADFARWQNLLSD